MGFSPEQSVLIEFDNIFRQKIELCSDIARTRIRLKKKLRKRGKKFPTNIFDNFFSSVIFFSLNVLKRKEFFFHKNRRKQISFASIMLKYFLHTFQMILRRKKLSKKKRRKKKNWEKIYQKIKCVRGASSSDN